MSPTIHTLRHVIIVHIKKKNVQEVKYDIEHQEMNITISCNALAEATMPQTLKIEGHQEEKCSKSERSY